MIGINKQTQVFVSLAEKPGNFGAVFFNFLFQKLSLNSIYKPLRVQAKDLAPAVAGIRSLGISGAGITMPHKQAVMKYLDKVDPVAKRIGAVNTIVNHRGLLTGYNTDYYGVKAALKKVPNLRRKSVLLLGAGGIARTFALALKQSGARQVYITNRNEAKGRAIARTFKLRYYSYERRADLLVNLFINASPLGMLASDALPVPEKFLRTIQNVIDVVVSAKKTRLIKMAEKLKLKTVAGLQITTEQAAAQFKLYTGEYPPDNLVKQAIEEYLK